MFEFLDSTSKMGKGRKGEGGSWGGGGERGLGGKFILLSFLSFSSLTLSLLSLSFFLSLSLGGRKKNSGHISFFFGLSILPFVLFFWISFLVSPFLLLMCVCGCVCVGVCVCVCVLHMCIHTYIHACMHMHIWGEESDNTEIKQEFLKKKELIGRIERAKRIKKKGEALSLFFFLLLFSQVEKNTSE
jgi:hypothetical protein